MARIDLRNCTVYLKDGLAGTAASAKKDERKANDHRRLVHRRHVHR